jgi:hypothetical protein
VDFTTIPSSYYAARELVRIILSNSINEANNGRSLSFKKMHENIILRIYRRLRSNNPNSLSHDGIMSIAVKDRTAEYAWRRALKPVGFEFCR